jgi:hypothetical protein
MTWPGRRPAVPASCADLSLAAVQKALLDKHGSVAGAAVVLHVPSSDLRKLVIATPSLIDTVFEELDRGVDRAIGVLLEGMESGNIRQRLRAASFFLRHTEAGRLRGSSRQ